MMRHEQIRQDTAPVAEPPEPHLYVADDCCGMMFFSTEPPAPKPRASHWRGPEEYPSD